MNDEKDYVEEKILKKNSKSVPIEVLRFLIELTEKRICKIELKDGGNGTGFFCSIPHLESWKTYNALITNNHVLSKENLLPGRIIKFSINNEKKHFKIKINEKRMIYSSEKEDVTIIELKPEDGISKNAFFEIDNRIFDKNFKNIFKNQSVFLLHYPKGTQMSFADGVIINIFEDNFTFGHSCDSSEGSSGGPIINSTTFQVIGLHKGGINKKEQINVGVPINLIINKIDCIKCVYNINIESLGQEVQFINNYGNMRYTFEPNDNIY